MARFLRRGWPVIIALYDGRECPDCCALVCGRGPQRRHEQQHRDTEQRIQDLEQRLGLAGELAELPDLGGYIIGNGPLPASVRGGGEE